MGVDSMKTGTAFAVLFALVTTGLLRADEPRSAAHEAYAETLDAYLN